MAGKATDLATLLRLRAWNVDERRRELGILIAREEELILLGEELDRQLIREQKVAAEDPTSVGYIYASFAKGHKARREQLQSHLAALRAEIEAAREQLNEAYREEKVLQEVQKERQRQEDEQEKRVLQASYDEIGMTQYRARDKG